MPVVVELPLSQVIAQFGIFEITEGIELNLVGLL